MSPKNDDTLRPVRIHDASGCYVAWNVVDSDNDGVCDADELMAGTDPFDPLSRPSLQLVAELASKQQLPSFEAGLGAFTVFPAELQTMLQKNRQTPLAAFPLARERKDTLTRLGISAALLKEHNIDLTSDGFTMGFGTTANTSVPGRRIGGVELMLISADDDPVPLDPNVGNHGAADKPFELGDGTMQTNYADGTMRFEYTDGGGSVYDKDGNCLGTWYVNPDADQTTTTPTPEEEDAFFRLHGATILTVEGWEGPDRSGTPRDPRATIILVDPEYAYDTAVIFDAPALADAQPEVRPDLPNPGVGAPPKKPYPN